MASIILINKPFGVLSQFTGAPEQQTLAPLIDRPGFYAAGRLDKDSEGLLVLTDDGKLQQRLSNPRFKHWKTYWAQVEGEPEEDALAAFRKGLELKDGKTLAAKAKVIPEPMLWPRNPPIRYRASIPTSWLEIKLQEGRNRQVRRMTAAIGHPTLRLVRAAIGQWQLGDLQPGQTRLVENIDWDMAKG